MRAVGRKILFCCTLIISAQLFAQGMPAVVQVAKEADWAALQTLINEGENVNQMYGDGSSALHWASYWDSIDGAKLLINAGAEVSARTDLGATPLWLAAENGNADMIALLLDAGADPNVALLAGETIVMTASRSGNADVVRQLLAAGADPNAVVTRNQTALMWAAHQGHGETVAALLEFGADVNARSLVREQYVKTEKPQDSHPAYKIWIEDGGNTALMFAARAGDLHSTRLLVQAGSDVNAVSAFGTSPAIMAIHGGNTQVLEYFLQNGANPDDATSGHTALHAAILRGNYDAVSVLLAHSASLNPMIAKATPARRQSSDYHFHEAFVGATPLWLAARIGEPRIMSLLLEYGADASIHNNVVYPAQRGLAEYYIAEEGEVSLLMAALGMGHWRLRVGWGNEQRRAGQIAKDRQALILETVKIAVQTGVDLNLKNAEGQTALGFAMSRRYEDVVEFLIEAGATEN
jgi:ankyrin repeat protein